MTLAELTIRGLAALGEPARMSTDAATGLPVLALGHPVVGRGGRTPGRRVTRPYLLDANALIALALTDHEHHERATAWVATADRISLCPVWPDSVSYTGAHLAHVVGHPQVTGAYLASFAAGVPCEVLHLATRGAIRPIPADVVGIRSCSSWGRRDARR